ncbi:MAG TPA: hypothetical protein VH134_07530 [Candidatus Dormibacteraeota bacterium]|nr:hypothetical protein [Candidatus Dormibacteraeota bacterium]
MADQERAAEPAARAALAVHLASLAGAFAALMYVSRNIWFFADDWEFLARRRHGTTIGVWVPHNEHWSTVPILVYRALYDLVGLRSYRPYMAVLLVVHLLLAHLLWRWMRRSGAGAWIATALAAMFLLLGAGWECLLFPFAMNFSGALLFGFAALLLADHDGRFGPRDVAAWAVAVVALMWSGVAVSMVAIMGIAVLLRRGVLAALATVSVPAAVYLAWFAAVGHHNANTTPASRAQLLEVPTFVWVGLTRGVEGITGLPGAGPVLVLALLVLLLRERDAARHRAAVAVAAALGTVALLALTGVGRIALGVDAAAAPRYAYAVGALLLVGTAIVVTELGRSSAAITAVVLAAVAAFTVQGAGQLVTAARARVAVLAPPEHQILAAARMVETGELLIAGPAALPEPRYSFDMPLDALRQLVGEGAFGTVPEQPPESRLAAALQLQVAVGPEPAVDGGPGPRLGEAPAAARVTGGCARLHGAGPVFVRLLFAGPGWVSVTPSAGGDLTVAMATSADPSLVSAPRTFPLTAGRTAVLSVSAADAAPVVSLPAGDDVVCGLRP